MIDPGEKGRNDALGAKEGEERGEKRRESERGRDNCKGGYFEKIRDSGI